jgi:uncharacterized membrane protein HdeD (DUF308 family)
MTSFGIEYPREPAVGKYWWLLLLSGILWIVIGLFVLEADFDSAVLIGYLVAFWLLFAGVAEFMQMGIAVGWAWLHVLLGVLFILGGIAALTSPFQTFTVLASLIGFFLVLKGSFDFGVALSVRHALDLWWLVLIGGILQIVIGIWAAGYPGRSAALLVLWIGIGAIVRGVVEISTSFHVRKVHEVVAA